MLTPTFTCPGDREVAIINTIGVVLSVVSDFVSISPSGFSIDFSVLFVPISRVIKLQINRKQKWALIGVFAAGTIVAAIEVCRGAFILAAGNTVDSIPLNLIMITVQTTLGIVVTNLPILRPLIFKRSFAHSSDQTHATNGRSWTTNERSKGAIPLYEVPEYAATVSAGGDIEKGKAFENGIMKSVEVRVESESVENSSIDSRDKRRRGSFIYM